MTPEKGTHDVYCSSCGKVYATVSHFCGENILDNCEYCKGFEAKCRECFEKWSEGAEEAVKELLKREKNATKKRD